MDQFETLINELGAATGIEGLRPDEDGAVQLLFGDALPVFIQPDPEREYVSLYAVVGLVGETIRGPLMLELLSASLFGREANGATFAIEETMGQIVLQRQERLAGLTYAGFQRVLESFIEAAEAWMQRLSPEADAEESRWTQPTASDELSQHHLRA